MAAGDLTTVAKVKTFLGISGTDDDTLLGTLITAASALIGNYLNRNLLTASYTEKYSGVGGDFLPMRQTPITAVSSLTVDGVVVPPSSDGVASPGYIFDTLIVARIGGRFTNGINNVSITYTAGYASVPADVDQACVELVALQYRERSRVGKKSDAQPQGGTVTYTEEALTPRCKAILANYKRQIPL